MIMHHPGKVATQGWTYKNENIEDWLNGRYRVKLWWNENWTDMQRIGIKTDIFCDLADSWLHRAYDVLGIIGQQIGIRKLQSPKQYYCSERVAKHLRAIGDTPGLGYYPTPADIDRWCSHIDQQTTGWKAAVYDPERHGELSGGMVRRFITRGRHKQ